MTLVAVLLPGRGMTRLVIPLYKPLQQVHCPLTLFFSCDAMVVWFFIFRDSYCREPLPGFVITEPLGFMNPPIRLGLSSSCSGATVIVAWWLPLVTLCLHATAKDCSDARATAGLVEREALNVGKVGATISLVGERTRCPPSTPRS